MAEQSQAAVGEGIDQAALIESLETFMQRFLDKRPLPDNLRAAIAYALLGGGKRLRPILAVRCCEAVGGSWERALPGAAAVEMIHAFSLVHDDLPAMDDDDLRRGRPTLHVATSEAMAILAGDALLGLAFELVCTHAEAGVAGLLCRELAVGNNDMIAGQVYDTLPEFDEHLSPMQRLSLIHENKTGALIRCACRMGAISGGASQSQLQAITQYAQTIGVMFQAVDDLIDVTQTTEHLGKTAGKDIDQNKLTYPSLLGIDGTKAEILRLHAEAGESLARLGDRAEALRQLCDVMASRTR